MTTFKELQDETDKYKETLVIDNFDIKLFLGVVEDPEDFYYEYLGRGDKDVTLASCVGWFIPLIGRLSKEQYNHLASVWNLNNVIQIKKVE